ncbi:MAG: class I SAM-dependent methyltransferase, partial [bacterium]|nr:class I SAM-dependent methyltransferase [bacterium]
AKYVFGIDNSIMSLQYGSASTGFTGNISLYAADALQLPFIDGIFDRVICIQNGISAFHVDPLKLIDESSRVLKTGGTAMYSSYSEKFWEHRLEWFELQAGEGMLGEIDHEKTGNGSIVCKDGFTATTFTEADFLKLTDVLDADISITEVDGSSLFCEITLN